MGLALQKMTESDRQNIAQKLFKVTSVRSGKGELHGLCPIHNEKNPSFGYNIQKDQFNCFGCGASGDLVELWILTNGYGDRKEGFKAFVKEYQIEASGNYQYRPPQHQRYYQAPAWQPGKVTAPEGVDVTKWREKADKLVAWAHEKLLAAKKQLGYLAGRGIRKETVVKFRLGYNPGEGRYHAFFRPRRSWGLPEEKKDNGLEKRLWIPRGIVIPYLQGNEVLRIRIRRNTEDLTEKFPARYYVVPGSTMAPMLIGPDRTAFVVMETELDGLLLDQEAGSLVGVLAMGSASAKPDDVAHQALKNSECVLNALDFDRAGYGAWRWWRDHFDQAERWPVPAGKDPGEAFEKGVDLREWVLSGLPPAFRMQAAHVGPFSLDGEDKGAEDFVDTDKGSAEEVMGVGHPEGLKELYGLLQRVPVEIRKSRRRVRLVEKMGSKDWEESRRVSQLVFMDPDVFDYLMGHPARVISKWNFWGGFNG